MPLLEAPRPAAPQPGPHTAPRRRRRTFVDRADVLSRFMLGPALVYVLLLAGIPFVLAIALSFSSATAGSLEFQWVGWRNFREIIFDPIFQRAVINTVLITVVSQVVVMILAAISALVLDAGIAGKRIFRFLLLLPWAVPVSLAALAWVWMFDSTFSVINWTLRVLGLLHGWLYWFGDPTLALIAIIVVNVWRMFPFATVIVLAGLTSIPQDIREATVVDGAGFWRRIFQIDLPLIMPIASVAVLFGIAFTATDLTTVYLLTNGGPYNSTQVLSTLAFQRGILGGDLGQGAAIALFLLPVLVLATTIMLRFARRTEIGQ